MTQKTRRISLLLLIGALLSVILLTTSLSNLQLQPGKPFPNVGNTDNAREPISSTSAQETLSLPVARGILALVFLILAIYVPARVIIFVNFRKLLRFVLIMVVLFGITTLMPRMAPGQSTYTPAQSTEFSPPPTESIPLEPLGQPPQALIQIIILAAVLGVGLLVFMIVKHSLKSTGVEDQLLQEAEDAVNALTAGSDLRNVIIRCYLQMTHVLQEEQGIERNEEMTVREFEGLLAARGFPAKAVHQLSRLFEKVRYGQQPFNKDDEKLAVESLNQIIRFGQNRKD